jgi:hypothetical protein
MDDPARLTSFRPTAATMPRRRSPIQTCAGSGPGPPETADKQASCFIPRFEILGVCPCIEVAFSNRKVNSLWLFRVIIPKLRRESTREENHT